MTRRIALLTAWFIACCMPPAFADDDDSSEDDDDARIYLSLGTSLSVGIQPDADGVNQRTDDGYADQLHDILEPRYKKLKLEKLGCPGETTTTMISGGKCKYPKGSQLAQAVKFLEKHEDDVALVTIDMGVNDVRDADCIDADTSSVDVACLFAAFDELSQNLLLILSTLEHAADEDTQIVAMNYYNTFLAFWFNGEAGQALAMQSSLLANVFNHDVLGAVYAAFGIPVADVGQAFDSSNFGDSGVPGVPQNVLNICLFTYMCTPPPVGPNIHANPDGYAIIAATLANEL